MKHILLIVVLLGGVWSGCRAQLTIEECQKLAQQNYPLIKKYDLINKSTAYTMSNIAKSWLPQIQASVQGTLQNRVAKLPDMLNTMLSQSGMAYKGLAKEQYKAQVEVNQTLWDGNRTAMQRETARRQGDVEAAQTDVTMYEVRRRVNDLFFSLLLLDERIRLNNDLLALLQNNENKLASLLQRGVAMQSDVDRMRAERLNAVQTNDELSSARLSAARMLALLCGVKHIDGVVKPAIETDIETTVNMRPELKLIDMQLRMTDAQQRQLNADMLPRISLFAQGYYGYPGYNMFDDMMRRRLSFNALAGVRLSWSIGSLYTHRNNIRRLSVQRAEAENAREIFLFNNNMEEIRQRENIESRRRVMKTDDEIVELRRAVRMAAESQLTHGIIDSDRLLQEITRENTARITRSAHEVELLQGIYEMKYIKGI